MLLPIVIGIASLVAVMLLAPGMRVLPFLGLVLAGAAGAASVAPLWKRNLRRTPLFIWGMVIAHLGIAVSLAGMASESAFTKERLVASYLGETQQVGPYTVKLDSVTPIAGPNWTAIEGVVTAMRGEQSFELKPQARAFWAPPTETNESAIKTVWDGQLYVVLGRADEQGRWQLRLWWKPFVTLIWAGGAMVAIGGTLALLGRLLRERRTAMREAWA
jgi:cytochrome c-type biogenesis protein CcmF